MPEDKDSKTHGSHQGSYLSFHGSHRHKKKHRHQEHGQSETLTLSRKSQAHSMPAIPKEMSRHKRSLKTFPTGSTYIGTWNALGMSGEGTYTFPHKGVVYKGEFDEGEFHGKGELQYECGVILKGKWHKGTLVERQLFFADGLEYKESDWAYVRLPDRRYTVEYDSGIEPAGRSYITSEQPQQPIPDGYYDVGDGVYDPITKSVYKYDDLTAIIRGCSELERKWVTENCRTSPDDPKGPCSFLYEQWMEPTLELQSLPPASIYCDTTVEKPEPGSATESDSTKAPLLSKTKHYNIRVDLGSTTDLISSFK